MGCDGAEKTVWKRHNYDLLLGQQIHALIGCDVLRECIFNYNRNAYFSLSW